jgi:tetratricopeptide (TPR) repeat protein
VVAKALELHVQTIEESLQALANSRRRWLLLLDNADDSNFDYSVYLPSGNRGTVILASRVPGCQKYSTLEPEALEGLELLHSTQLLLKAARLPEASWSFHIVQAQDIVHLLGSHTLALIQAGAYIADGYCRLPQYAENFRRQRRQLLEHHPAQEKSRYQNVYATFEASLEGLKHSGDEAGQDALDLLATLSMLHSSPLPLMVFQDAWVGARMVLERDGRVVNSVSFKHAPPRSWRSKLLRKSFKQTCPLEIRVTHRIDALDKEHVSRLPRLLGTQLTEWDDYRLKKASAILTSLSLVTRHHFEGTDGLSMHPLAHAWAKDRLEPMQQQQSWTSTACLFALARRRSHLWRVHERELLPHIQSLFSSEPEVISSCGPQKMMLPLLLRCGWVLAAFKDHGRVQILLEIIYRELGITPWTIPEQHPSSIMLTSRAALHLRNTRLAIALLEHVNKVQKTTPEELDLPWLQAQLDLASAYNDNGDAQKAVPLLERLVKAYKMMPPTEESLACEAFTQNELSRAYNLNGQTQQAVALLEEVVDRHQAALETKVNHERLRSQHALAIAYTANGQSNDAVALLEEVVKAYETLLDDANPDRLTSQQELARAYDANGQVDKSLPLLEHVVKVKKNTFEDTDHSLLISQYALSFTYSHLGQIGEALKLREHIVNMYEIILEETHHDRLAAEYFLALTYIDAKQPTKALALMRHVVDIHKKRFEHGYPQRRESERWLEALEAGTVYD